MAHGASENDDLGAVCEAEPEREPDPSDSLRTFGAVVQALREHAGFSRVEFGELVRFSNTRWSRWSWGGGCRTSPSWSGRRRRPGTRGH
ncbi:hypothetical protein Srubr_36870 [Streptomyces rubradiris]|uniref:Helix-turn-helix domain-containing protein n=1 Tax=Streptomyces rubradiris TaxID=285531 RepID=A0ABQ3RD92_STRRR|nr:hypothetical protein GCM10018792_05790 [Streptomyces rubradiris]GHI53841.1 hypothetical protein Srubr_36870 [Streptomyces rubradiris]